MSTIPTPGNTIIARKGAGADQGPQSRLQFNDGGTTTVTVVDDPANNEIDITITSAGGGGTEWIDLWQRAPNPDNTKGTYATMLMPDEIDTIVNDSFLIPSDIVTITRAVLIIIPNAGGNIRWSTNTNFGQVCANEGYQTHTDSTAAADTAVTQDEIECLDFSGALTGIAGDDLVGISFTRHGSHANDTVNEGVHFLGIIIQGTTT